MRPRYGDVFNFDRMLNVFFYTSNIEKLIQSRIIFLRHGYRLRHYSSQQEPYDEDYSLGTQGLLDAALRQISRDFDLRSIVFVEDTSLRLDALSEIEDYPGTRVKEWFKETSFEELNRHLKIRNRGRRAVVKSDIALRIPTLSRPIFFHGETAGHVAESPPQFAKSVQYPWLTPDTFNGWFVPDGTDRRLGEMEFEESLAFDFRAKSIISLLERLEELNAAINLGQRYHSVRKMSDDSVESAQMSLLASHQPDLLLVIGQKCAGKSTFGDFIAGQHGGTFILEASTILRQVAAQNGKQVGQQEEVLQYLRENGWDLVARRAANYIDREGASLNIITGLRTVEEILCLKLRYPEAKVILIEADERSRFERHIKRARHGDPQTFRDFKFLDEFQNEFGLLRVGQEVADIIIKNDSDIRSYHRKIVDLLKAPILNVGKKGATSELYRSMRALRAIGRAATCDEIAKATEEQGNPVRRYNNNRALKGTPEFASRIERRGHLLRYRLSDRGVALLKLLEMGESNTE